MQEIISMIRKIKEDRIRLETQIVSLLEQENELKLSISVRANVSDILKKFLELKGIDRLSNQKQIRMFIYVSITIICPGIHLNERMPNNVRKELNKYTGVNPARISYLSREVINYYHFYKDFKSEADYLYEEIKRSLMS